MDACVIGGGVIGLSVAWRAAVHGLRVAVADPDPGSGASRVAAGMIAAAGEAHFGEEALLALCLESAAAYPAFIAGLEEASGSATGYRECGTVLVAAGSDENAALQREFLHRRSLGLGVERLTSRECRELEPSLAPSIRGGVLVAGDHQVDPRALLPALRAACERAGVDLHLRRAAVRIDRGRVTGVALEGGLTVDASRVVLAAGCWSAAVDGVPAEALPPVRPVKGQILRLRGPADVISRSIRSSDVYLVPRGDGRVVVGATSEERGFDTTVTGGAVHDLLRDARALVPDVGEMELVEAAAGLRPGSPDNAPVIGDSCVDGLVVATGHHRNGFLLAPVTAGAVAGALAGLPWPQIVSGCSPARFQRAPEVVA